MEINNTDFAGITSSKSNTVNKVQEDQDQNANVEASNPASSQSVALSLSNAGMLTQELDKTSQEIDQVLMRHLSPEQKKELNNIYQKLDKEFESSNLSEKKIENLFEQAHKILDTSVDKLSSNERKQVDSLVNKMDQLEGQLAGAEQLEFGGSVSISGGREPAQEQEVGSAGGAGKKKKALTVAELNALSAAELNKLPAHLLKKLNVQQLNKLNASQLNQLPENLLSKLTPANLAKTSSAKPE